MGSSEWDLPPHTRAKHALLEEYLKGWYAILGKTTRRAVFLDGFAGRGIYNDGSPGSPVIALRTLLDHRAFPSLQGCEFAFVFVEKDADNFASLQHEVAAIGKLPANVKVVWRNDTFENAAMALTVSLAQQRKTLAPTFAFIDPFGFAGLPLRTIRDLLSFPRCEVFVNFMLDHVNRFAEDPKVSDAMDGLFATRDYLQAAKAPDRMQFLAELYQRQLRDYAGFDYVSRFEMRRSTDRVAYHLLHGTKHIRGVEVMKQAMWKVDPGGGSCFSDRFEGQNILFTGDNVDVGPLSDALCRQFAGQTVTPKKINDYTVVETPYAPSHWNRKVLVPLEKAGKITANRPEGRRGFPAGVTVTFPS